MKEFNTTAVCKPEKHYMVDISKRVEKIKELVDAGKYFTINRARQYGKTTTLTALYHILQEDYVVVSISFEGVSSSNFSSEQSFVKAFCRKLMRECRAGLMLPNNIKEQLEEYIARKEEKAALDELFDTLMEWCFESERSIVLIIDEVDSPADEQVFLDFLAQLRDSYISRDAKGTPAFQSVILAGVNDIKHLKSKIRPDEDEKENSPWNIAADFDIDMSLSEDGIKGMLNEYEADHHTGMDTANMAKLIWDQTSGYPFLVSRICQLIDERVCKTLSPSAAWTKEGFLKAVKMLLAENNSLFQSITGKLNKYPKLRAALRSILMEGTKLTYTAQTDSISQMQMYGLIKNDNNTVAVANRTFETMLYNLFLSEAELKNNVFYNSGELEKNRFIKDGKLDMPAIFLGFIKTYNQVVEKLVDRFKEEEGREFFLLYLKPIINGTGNFYIESQTRDQLRTDVIVDYLGEQYIIELKVWRGPRYNEEGEQQVCEYLDRFDLQTGYMLSFNFNEKKEQGIKEYMINGKKLIEATV